MGVSGQSALKSELRRIDGKGYKAYKDIAGEYEFDHFRVCIDHVQGDPFAAPSRIRVRVDRKISGFAEDTTANRSREIALRDFLTRQFHVSSRRFARGQRGIGKSGQITIDAPGQEILERSAMVVTDDFVEARFFMALPAFGRKIAGKDAEAMFFSELPAIVHAALFFENLDAAALYRHIQTAEDADAARGQLRAKNLIAFVADGSLLPRKSGIDFKPMNRDEAVFFKAPETDYRVQLALPNAGTVEGMGIYEGVNVIVGGGYHGKSTLLEAMELGVYNHIPGDGRELVVSLENSVKIRACDGRSIEKTNISPFINNLPLNKDTTAFSTTNASGSTSQAANIIEAVEIGADVLLLDEDTSATNFMIRDHRMQQLVAKDREPITPFIDKVGQLYTENGISTVLVMGGSGDYFSMADHVICMTQYLPHDVTGRAREIAESDPSNRTAEGGQHFGDVSERYPAVESFDPYRKNSKLKIAARGTRDITFGKTDIDIADLEQLVDPSQARAIGNAIHYARKYMKEGYCLKDIVKRVQADIESRGLDILVPYVMGDLAGFRAMELAAAINRMRTLKVKQAD
ncbi:MAG: ABC-ATPase domain-containing protein [Thermodesulfobacteriota bacterium]